MTAVDAARDSALRRLLNGSCLLAAARADDAGAVAKLEPLAEAVDPERLGEAARLAEAAAGGPAGPVPAGPGGPRRRRVGRLPTGLTGCRYYRLRGRFCQRPESWVCQRDERALCVGRGAVASSSFATLGQPHTLVPSV